MIRFNWGPIIKFSTSQAAQSKRRAIGHVVSRYSKGGRLRWIMNGSGGGDLVPEGDEEYVTLCHRQIGANTGSKMMTSWRLCDTCCDTCFQLLRNLTHPDRSRTALVVTGNRPFAWFIGAYADPRVERALLPLEEEELVDKLVEWFA